MKCTRCGEEIPSDCVYCSKCGKEIQYIPEYNAFEEDLLQKIVEKGGKGNINIEASDEIASQSELNNKKQNRKKIAKPLLIGIGCILFVVLATYITNLELHRRQDNSFSYQYKMAQEAYELGNYQEAIDYYNRALEIDPSAVELKFEMVDIYTMTKQEAMAESLLLKLIHDKNYKTQAYERLLELYEKQENYGKIQDLLEDVNDPDLLQQFSDYMVSAPKFDSVAGSYSYEFAVTIMASAGDEVYYTLDGSDPINYGTLYTAPVAIKTGETILKAVSENDKGIYSSISTVNYTIYITKPPIPTVSPDSGVYQELQLISVAVPYDSKAYYTWDGTIPTRASYEYVAPLEMPEGDFVFSVICINNSGLSSEVSQTTYSYHP
ncbi:MAG: chitobiase/beta-hexosaminidase C-terminal domain-containing protein [Lachnospiraceae bacterium]